MSYAHGLGLRGFRSLYWGDLMFITLMEDALQAVRERLEDGCHLCEDIRKCQPVAGCRESPAPGPEEHTVLGRGRRNKRSTTPALQSLAAEEPAAPTLAHLKALKAQGVALRLHSPELEALGSALALVETLQARATSCPGVRALWSGSAQQILTSGPSCAPSM